MLNIVRAELDGRAAAADPQQQAGQFAMLPELLATGRYPRFAAAIAERRPAGDVRPGRPLRPAARPILDGLVRPNDA